MQVWNVLLAARCKYRNTGHKKVVKNCHLGTIAQLRQAIYSQLRHVSTIGKKLVKQQYLLHMSLQYGELGPLAAEICWRVWGTPANFNRFRVLAALLHSTVVVGIGQTLRHWTEGATYIRQGSHHVGHWPTFLVVCDLVCFNLCHFVFVLFAFVVLCLNPSVLSQEIARLGKTSPKWPVLCWVERKTLTE